MNRCLNGDISLEFRPYVSGDNVRLRGDRSLYITMYNARKKIPYLVQCVFARAGPTVCGLAKGIVSQ